MLCNLPNCPNDRSMCGCPEPPIRGRPRLPDSERRDTVVSTRLSAAQYAFLMTYGKRRSDALRALIAHAMRIVAEHETDDARR